MAPFCIIKNMYFMQSPGTDFPLYFFVACTLVEQVDLWYPMLVWTEPTELNEDSGPLHQDQVEQKKAPDCSVRNASLKTSMHRVLSLATLIFFPWMDIKRQDQFFDSLKFAQFSNSFQDHLKITTFTRL